MYVYIHVLIPDGKTKFREMYLHFFPFLQSIEKLHGRTNELFWDFTTELIASYAFNETYGYILRILKMYIRKL